ncbi:Ldh family oxidoreductase [Egicoccus halophilus]|uniref:Dehydrogenase n=1 Tax=Egicoccus halophilus TaxID=1670830 RepID=A0A8J3AAK4_9ACTN|nr:Ldh family oxidoreductase [Egicoccus halophilus]GGI08699.1 dehydrogenase [Egicoccus halophilus]
MRLAYEHLLQMCATILTAADVPEDAAHLQARLLVEADAREHASHGVQRLPTLIGRLANGVANANPRIAFDWRSESALVVDGDHGLGPVVVTRALAALQERAARHGIALAAIRNANHLGMLAFYLEDLAQRGYVALAVTTSEALVHPWGGRDAMVGTNPLAIAVPAEPEPLVLDMATAAVSMGRVIATLHEGGELADGWALDADGVPTRDPAAAIDGALSPFGGVKGYALGIAIEALVGALTGTHLGRDVTGTLDEDCPPTKGDVFIVIDPNVLGIVEPEKHVGAYLAEVRDSPLAAGSADIRIPGDGGRRTRSRNRQAGVPVADATWQRLCDLADQAGVPHAV